MNDLKKRENTNKELHLFFNEKNTEIKTIDDLNNLPKEIIVGLEFLKRKNLIINPNKKNYKKYMNKIFKGLKDGIINFL